MTSKTYRNVKNIKIFTLVSLMIIISMDYPKSESNFFSSCSRTQNHDTSRCTHLGVKEVDIFGMKERQEKGKLQED